MSIPHPDPSNPALPSPLFSDLTAVRADHMRANNAAIFADLAFLDANNPALVALTGGSFKTAALANANTYNGRSTYTCAAAVTDTPYAGKWRVAGVWNPTESSGQFVAMFDSSNETWEINYSGAAWGAWALVGYGETAFARKEFVQSAGGWWADIIWVNSTTVRIAPKTINGQTAFIGVILNNGKYIETTTALTKTLAPAGSGGAIIDGITAVLNNAWYIPWFYENSTGDLDVGFTWMPHTTFSNNNPTTSLTLNTVNSQNIGYLFSTSANLGLWEASTKLEFPYYNTTGGYTPTGGKTVSSRNATTITLNAACAVTNFLANDYVYQVDNFQPLSVADGNIVSVIGTRGYKDSGVRVLTDSSAHILEFRYNSIQKEMLRQATNLNLTASATKHLCALAFPVDATQIKMSVVVASTPGYCNVFFYPGYYDTANVYGLQFNAAGANQGNMQSGAECLHGLLHGYSDADTIKLIQIRSWKL